MRAGRPISIAPQGGQEFRTPSGKLEFYSEQLAAQGLPPMPDWQPDPEEERDAARWPLRLLTAPGYFQSHTAYSGVAFLRRREGPPCCILHPDEARRAAASPTAPQVRLFNERGAVGLVLEISDEVQPGVVLVPGQRPDGETVVRHRQHAVLRPLHRYRRGRDLSEHLPRRRRVGLICFPCPTRGPLAGRVGVRGNPMDSPVGWVERSETHLFWPLQWVSQ